MRLSNYIINESRSEEIEFGEVRKLVKTDFSQAWRARKINKIYRGTESKFRYSVIDPSRFERKSRNTSNHYTLLFDNLPSWKNYPKRSKSLICTTCKEEAIEYSTNYGEVYLVLPKNNAKIGICPLDDIWISFPKLSYDGLQIINNFMRKLNISDTNWNSMKKDLHDEFNNNRESLEWFKESIKSEFVNSDIDIIDFLNKYFDPKYNKFELSKITNTIPLFREVWTDSKCLLINSGSAFYLNNFGDF